MKIQRALEIGYRKLINDSAKLDTELVLAKACKISREKMHAHPERNLSFWQQIKFRYYLRKAWLGKPIAYILGHKDFFGLSFFVDKNVLIPRPDTEILVEEALKILDKKRAFVVEIGTGSGCIACALAHNAPQIKVLSYDVSQKALRVAQKNLKNLKLQEQVSLRQADLLVPELKKADLIIANLPYIPSKEYHSLPNNIKKYEPRLALEAGHDGLKYYRQLLDNLSKSKATILLEISDEKQARKLTELFPSFDYSYLKDLSGSIRALKIKKKPNS